MPSHGTTVYGKNKRSVALHNVQAVVAQTQATTCHHDLGKPKCREACHSGKCPVRGIHENCISTSRQPN